MAITDNPIDNDDRLRRLLSKIREIKSQKAYNTWRKEFLRIYTKYLDKNGILNGKDANYRLLKQLENLSNRIQLVLPILEQDTLNATSTTSTTTTSTKKRRLLKNLTDEVVATERKVQELLPKTHADEERFGFDKFELAAVLLEDGFHVYDTMNQSRQVLEAIAEHTRKGDSHNCNTNELTILHQYSDSVESFVRVMEDLKLVKIMNHCVDIVYKGAKRPEPKPPPPPSEEDDDDNDDDDYSNGEEVLTEDSSICSDLEGDSFHVETKRAPPSRSISRTDDLNKPRGESSESAKTKKKKRTKPSNKALSQKEPIKKTKKPKKKQVSQYSPELGANDDAEEMNLRAKPKDSSSARGFSSSKPKSSRKQPSKKSPSKSSRREDDYEDGDDSSYNDNDESDDSSESEEEEEEKDQNQGEPPEFLLYFDPKTNSIGRINREQAVAKSTLIVDKSKEAQAQAAYADSYKNVIESQEEKQDLIFLLKKLEKQKPQEESWLDAIKREKLEATAKSGNKSNNSSNTQKTKFHKSTAGILGRRNSNSNSNSATATNSMKSPTGTRTKRAGTTESSKFKKISGGKSASNRRSTGISKPKSYKLQIADKPDTSGWSKPASCRGLSQ